LKRRQEFFVYSTGRLAAIAAGGIVTTFLNIQADADFVLEKLTYGADIAGAAVTINTYPAPNVLVLLISSGAGQNLFQNPLPLTSLFGTGALPFILPFPRVLPANSQLQITLTSVEAVSTPLLTLNFIGRKLYLLGQTV
ncbi:MAG: hypothetical protein ACREUY_09605, partial [Burkholderiales bacterium]